MPAFDFKPYFSKLNTYLDLRDLAPNTRKSYLSFLRSYLTWLADLGISPEKASYEDIRNYILYLKNVKGLKNHSINAHTSQIRFFRLYILKQPWDRFEVPTMKFHTTLPEILTLEETLVFIGSMGNLKHKTCVALLYSSGLRVSELCHLRYQDISRKDMRIFISASKNRSERYALLSGKALDILTEYWNHYGRPKGWLFPGAKKDAPIVTYTVSCFIKKHLEHLGWTNHVSAHTFRHSFATHLYERGEDLLTIQNLLGHKSINSTTLYIHLARKGPVQTRSPFDWEVE